MGRVSSGEAPRALDGVVVLDIGHWIAGPFGPTLLADFGATVIKVEPPNGQSTPMRNPVSWAVEQRNKKCITLALNTPRGRELFLDLVRRADVVVENFSPGTLERWDLSYARLSEANERLILVRVSGFGQTGPYRDRPAFDRLAIAMGGLTYTTGFPDSPPVRPGFQVADYGNGLMSAFATMVALFNRDGVGTGKGQEIDLALYETIFRLSGGLVPQYGVNGTMKERSGNTVPGISPGDQFKTLDDRWVVIHAGADHHFRRLFETIGLPELAHSDQFATLVQRAPSVAELNSAVAPWVAARTHEEVIDTLVAAGVPVSLVYNAEDISKDPHYQARDMIIDVDDPTVGRVPHPAPVPKLSRTPGQVYAPAPTLGQHNSEVYEGLLGLSSSDIDALRAEGII